MRTGATASPASALWKGCASPSSCASDRLLPVDHTVAEEWGRLRAIRSVPVVDALIAATARVHALTLVTRNEKDVAGLGVATLNPAGQCRGL